MSTLGEESRGEKLYMAEYRVRYILLLAFEIFLSSQAHQRWPRLG